MMLYLLGIIIVVGLCTYLIIQTIKLQKIKVKKSSKDVAEILKALDEAERYNDGEGWIAIRKIDRRNYFDVGKK
jgi:hypothetical protein